MEREACPRYNDIEVGYLLYKCEIMSNDQVILLSRSVRSIIICEKWDEIKNTLPQVSVYLINK